jgi:TPR repeat protein
MDIILSCHVFDDVPGDPPQNTQELAYHGNAQAQFWVGFKLACEGTASSFSHAGEWYQKAAEQGHSLAQFNLGIMYSRGQGFERNRELASFWFTNAAERGDSAAQYMLGMNYNRLSLDQLPAPAMESRIEAFKWLQLAAAQGYGDASAGCDLVAMGMTIESVKEATRRAEAFVCVEAPAV